MWKLFFDFLTEPLGLPIEWYWEYLILAIIGIVAYIVAYRYVGNLYDSGDISSRGMGSFLHWLIRLIFFAVIWAITYGVITVGKWIIAHWIAIVVTLAILVILSVSLYVSQSKRGKTKSKERNDICQR